MKPNVDDASVELYQDKRGKWRWRFMIYREKNGVSFWDIKAVSSDAYSTAGLAEYNARLVICTPWVVDIGTYMKPLKWYDRLFNFFFSR